MTLKESDGISYRNEKMLLSSVRGLSEAKPSCPSQCFAFKQLLIPLDIPRFWNGTAWPLPDRLLLFKTASASRRYYKADDELEEAASDGEKPRCDFERI